RPLVVLSASRSGGPGALHSFPTRRSSDLDGTIGLRGFLPAPSQALGHLEQGREVGPHMAGREAGHDHAPLVTPGIALGREQTQLDRKSTRLNSSHVKISYAVFCLKKKKPT